jgi:hypothetical protein
VIISDRDPRFTGRFWRELWRLLDTQLHMSTGGHPQTDGKAENRQRTANTMLRHYVDFEQDDWDDRLIRATHAINHTKSVSTGLTPFEVMFRRAPRLPLDAALDTLRQNADTAGAPAVPAVTNFLQRHQYLWDAARSNLTKAQADQKKQADRHRRDVRFAVGDEVLLSTRDLAMAVDPERPRAAKLTARFVGPFKVTRIINDNAYELELPPQLRIHPVQNISKLRAYVRSPVRFAGRPQPVDRPAPDMEDATAGEQWHVERLLAKRGTGARCEYLVKWLGYPNEDCSWEPRRNLNCPDLLAEFEARQHAPMEIAFVASSPKELVREAPPQNAVTTPQKHQADVSHTDQDASLCAALSLTLELQVSPDLQPTTDDRARRLFPHDANDRDARGQHSPPDFSPRHGRQSTSPPRRTKCNSTAAGRRTLQSATPTGYCGVEPTESGGSGSDGRTNLSPILLPAKSLLEPESSMFARGLPRRTRTPSAAPRAMTGSSEGPWIVEDDATWTPSVGTPAGWPGWVEL